MSIGQTDEHLHKVKLLFLITYLNNCKTNLFEKNFLRQKLQPGIMKYVTLKLCQQTENVYLI